MNVTMADPKTINHFKVYDLTKYGWIFENTNDGITNNQPIIEEISRDFSETTGLPFKTVIKVFDIDYIYSRSTEHLLLLFSNKGTNEVHYNFINANQSIYRELNLRA